MKVFERMSRVLTENYLNIREQWLREKQKGSFFVITANTKGSEIVSFTTFDDAESFYYDKYLAKSDSNIVLTHLKMPNFEQISMAYSNYVLTMHAFLDDFRVLVAKKIVQCVREGSYFKFIKYFNIYNRNVRSHFENLSTEVRTLQECLNEPSITKSQINNWRKETKNRLMLWLNETNEFLSVLGRETKGRLIARWLVMSKIRSMAKAVSEGQRPIK